MVQINSAVEEDDVWGMVAGRTIKGLSFSVENPPGSKDYVSLPISTSYTGVTIESLQKRQATDFSDKNKLKFYDPIETGGQNKDPIYDLIATLQTDYREPGDDEDEGVRRIFFTSSMRRALQDEVRAKGIKRFGIGTRITVTLTGFKPNPKGKPTKMFNVDLVPTAWVAPDVAATEAVLNDTAYTTQTQWANSAAVAAQQPAAQGMAQVLAAVAPAAPPVDPEYAAFLAAKAAAAAPVAPPVDPEYAAFLAAKAEADVEGAAHVAEETAARLAKVAADHEERRAAGEALRLANTAPKVAAINAAAAATTSLTITDAQLGKVRMLQAANIDRATALAAVAGQEAPGDEVFLFTLDKALSAADGEVEI